MPNNHRQKTAGSPEPGLPALNLNAADGYENQLSATAEIINTSSAKGTATLTLKVNRYLEAIQTCTLLLSSLFDEAERGDSFTTRATPEVLSETVWFNDFQPT